GVMVAGKYLTNRRIVIVPAMRVAQCCWLLRTREQSARLILSEVRVDDRQIRISGSKALLARAAAEGLGTSSPSVPSFVWECRAKADEDENWCVSLIT